MFIGRLRPFIGILLVAATVFGIYFWESRGREAVFTEETVVAARDIRAGETLEKELFTLRNIEKESIANGVLSPEELSRQYGKAAACDITENTQITKAMVKEKEAAPEGRAPFVLKEEWIAARSASLRSGDTVDIYTADMAGKIGSYKVAFVRDEDEQPVAEAGDAFGGGLGSSGGSTGLGSSGSVAGAKVSGYGFGSVPAPAVWERGCATGRISSIEIAAKPEEYAAILEYLASDPGFAALILVQRDIK